MLKRFLLFLIGVAMLVPCAIVSMAVLKTAFAVWPRSLAAVPHGAWAFALGFGLWVFIFFTMPRPARVYVLAHELTHALWSWLTGVRVMGMKVGKDSGSVAVSDNNILITLAPYFFPLYAVIVLALYGTVSIFADQERWRVIWLAAVGLTWAFHVTFTVATLMEHQSDIKIYGRMFSYSLIYVINALEIGFWMVAVSPATLKGFGTNIVNASIRLYGAAEALLR